ncbi:hypothetical protein J4230_03120 [Candidatus Woesearchaeota archaeon]|nr:hypothetical protein [Candidatus Woesearchaeota archaeon]
MVNVDLMIHVKDKKKQIEYYYCMLVVNSKGIDDVLLTRRHSILFRNNNASVNDISISL